MRRNQRLLGQIAGIVAIFAIVACSQPVSSPIVQHVFRSEQARKAKAALHTCPGSLEVKDAMCNTLYPLPEMAVKNNECKMKCNEAKMACKQAEATCKSGAAKEAADAGKGAADVGGDAAGVKGPQSGTMGGAGSAACDGQKANQNRANDLGPIPNAMQKCQSKAAKCEDPSGPEAAGKAGQNAAEAAKNIGERLADAGQMGQMCDKDKQNEDKMPQMPQIPQMPQQKDDQSPTDTSTLTNDLDTGTGTNTSTSTSAKIDSMNFGDKDESGKIGMSEVKPSQISGHQGSGPVSGGGAGPGPSKSSDGFGGSAKGNEFGANTGKVGNSGGSGGLNTTGASQPKEKGVAGADIKPESGSSYEVNPSAGKSVLGLKGGSSEEDLAGLVGQPQKGTAAVKGADVGKGGVGAMGAGSNAGTEGGQTIFQLIHHRYVKLKELGSI